jgi:hypothetical protein
VAHERKISVGVRQGDAFRSLSGVQEGEQVVTSGGLGLDDKGKVSSRQPKADEDEDEDKGDEDDGQDDPTPRIKSKESKKQ